MTRLRWRRARDRERELDAELQDHLERLVREHVRAGLSPAAARRAAHLDLGAIEPLKEACRDVRGTRWARDVWRDVRIAVRGLMRDRWFAAVAIASLALGLGVAAMVFSIIDAYYFRGVPGRHAEQLLFIGTRDAQGRGRDTGVSWPDYDDWRRTARGFDGLAAFSNAAMTIGDRGLALDRRPGAYVAADTFRLLDAMPLIGRVFTPDDDRPGAPPVVILSQPLWTSRYLADPHLIGRAIQVDGVSATVIGVMPNGFGFPFLQEMWRPLAAMPSLAMESRDTRSLGVLARVRADVSRADALANLARVAGQLATRFPETNAGIGVRAVRFGQQQTGTLGDSPVLLLPVMAVLVLLIACANVASLLLGRSAGRMREMAIRASIGATRWRLVRQLSIESLLLALVASGVALALAAVGVHVVADAFRGNVPYWMDVTVGRRGMAALVLIACAAAVVFGLAPALSLSKTDASRALAEGGRSSTAPQIARWTHRFVSVQLALTIVLLGGAGLLARSFLAVYEADRVVDPSGLLTASVEMPASRTATRDERAAFYDRLGQALAADPSIAAATLTSALPFLDAPDRRLSILGRPLPSDTRPTVPTIAIGPTYFETLRVSLLRGRTFASADGQPGMETAVVNQRFVEVYLPGEDAIGRQIRLDAEVRARRGQAAPIENDQAAGPWLTIVGVAPTIRQAMAAGPRPVVYVPYRSELALSTRLVVRGRANTRDVGMALRTLVARVDPSAILSDIKPLADAQRNSRLQPQLFASMFGLFGVIALALSAIGLYAVTAYAVTRRTREVGVRMALGARPAQVVILFLRQGLGPLGTGLAFGLIGAIGLGRLLESVLIRTSAVDPVTLVLLAVLLVGVCLTACFIPALRASAVDPAATLRHD